MTLQVRKLQGPPYLAHIAGSVSFVILLNLLQMAYSDNGHVLAILYMAVPAALVVFSAINISKHYKTNPKSFKHHLPFFISVILVAAGEEIWEIEEQFFESLFPSIADLFYLGFYLFFTWFLLNFLKPVRRSISKKTITFGALLSISLLIPTLMATYDYNSEEDTLPFLLLLSYPILDAFMFGIIVTILLFVFSKSVNYYWILIGGGVLLWVFADTAFLYAEVTDTYYDGHPTDAIYIFTYIMWIFAIIHDTKIIKSQNYSYTTTSGEPDHRITFQSIRKFAIPVSWLVTISISIYVMYLLGLFEFTDGFNDKLTVVSLCSGIMGALSVIMLLIIRNMNQLLRLREFEIEEKNNELRKTERLSTIGQVTARFSHDIRNPLTAIKNGISIIAYKQKCGEKIDDSYIENIQRAIFRITHQTDDILDFLRETKLFKTPNSLIQIINSSLSYLTLVPGIKLSLPKNDAMINCNPSQIERVFVNMILNSIQALENAGNIAIRIVEEKEFVKIEFEDTGPGVPEQDIRKLFEPLFTTKQAGTGLGLTTCKKIVESHGGKITFKNSPTTFTITLPK